MKLKDVGEIIAERELGLEDGRTVQVLIGKPQPFPDEKDYYCPFQIIGIRHEKVLYGAGVDSIQALVLALQMIGANLYTSDEARAGTLTWFGQGNFGIPVASAIQDLVPEDGK